MNIFLSILSILIGYLLGSISFGILIARKNGHDIRSEGSHNTGASNALRVLGLKGGALTFAGDFAKAALAVIAGSLLMGRPGAMLAGLGVVLGHNWPLYFSFKGGKGIACSTAVLLFTFPPQGGIAVALCLIVIALTKYISVGSLTMVTVFFVLMCVSFPFYPYAAWALILMLLAWYRHRGNLKRLYEGNENKIGKKATR